MTLFLPRRIVPLVVTGRHSGAHPLTISGAIVAVVQPLYYQHGARTEKKRGDMSIQVCYNHVIVLVIVKWVTPPVATPSLKF